MTVAKDDPRPLVAILDASVAVTGGLRCAQRMARLLSPWFRFMLVLPRDADIEAGELEPFAMVERLPLVQLRKSAPAMLLYGPALLLSGARLLHLLRRHGASTLIVNDFFQLQGWVARRRGWRGRVLTWVRFDPRRFPRAIAGAWLHAAHQCSDRIVAVSDFIQQLLPARLDAIRIYDCIDPGLLGAERPRSCSSDIVYVGNYIRGKGQDQAIEAFIRIAPDHPDARLLFYGGDMGLAKNRAFRAGLEFRAREAGLQNRILFHDFARDVPSVMSAASIALNLSSSESFSLSCLEAQQLGLPLVAYRSGGPEEIVLDGQTGLLVDVGDVDGAAAALSRLLADPQRAEAMGQEAARSVEKRFGPETFISSLLSLLQAKG